MQTIDERKKKCHIIEQETVVSRLVKILNDRAEDSVSVQSIMKTVSCDHSAVLGCFFG